MLVVDPFTLTDITAFWMFTGHLTPSIQHVALAWWLLTKVSYFIDKTPKIPTRRCSRPLPPFWLRRVRYRLWCKHSLMVSYCLLNVEGAKLRVCSRPGKFGYMLKSSELWVALNDIFSGSYQRRR